MDVDATMGRLYLSSKYDHLEAVKEEADGWGF